jgi:nitroreductase
MTEHSSPGLLDISADELLHSTRSVRRRLDFDRPLSRSLLTECVETALQAPSGSNRWVMQFVIVTDREKRAAFGDIYREAYEEYKMMPTFIGSVQKSTDAANESQGRTARSAGYLAENFHRAPAIVLACAIGRAEGGAPIRKTTLLGSVLPGMWSFMLAARLRGLGTSWTTVGLFREERVHELFNIPSDSVTIGAVTPVAFTRGTDFKPALRPAPEEVIHWDTW